MFFSNCFWPLIHSLGMHPFICDGYSLVSPLVRFHMPEIECNLTVVLILWSVSCTFLVL